MGTVVGRFVIAAVLVVAGAACWAEAAVALRVADARQQLATLRYDASNELEDTMSVTERLPGRVGSLGLDIRRHEAMVSYWTSRYDELAAATANPAPSADPELLLISANAAFRSSQKELGGEDRQAAVTKLDSVLQSYSAVLKAVPRHPDAAFNYEYVVRVRDAVANGRPLPPAKPEAETPGLVNDLPTGRTPLGQPGGPPAGARMEEFEIVTPKRGDERGSDAGTNEAERPRRRG